MEIIEERNRELREIEDELEDLLEISLSLSYMLNSQGEFIDQMDRTMDRIEEDFEVGIESLEKAGSYKKKVLRNVGLVVGGISLGVLGFIASPFVGIATTISGIAIGVGAAKITSKFD